MTEERKEAQSGYTQVCLIRHGEINNPQGVIYGRSIPVELSQKGRVDSRNLTSHLKTLGIRPNLMFVSPQLRTIQTAEEIQKHFPGLKIKIVDALQETNSGLEGKSLSELKESREDVYTTKNTFWRSKENTHQVTERVVDFINKVISENHGKTIFIVSHGDPLAFALWKIIHPEKKIPLIHFLEENIYLQKAEACLLLFDVGNKLVRYNLISLRKQAA